LEILTGAAKYDAACTSSGVNRSALPGLLGSACSAGICHSFSADGRCITLLKVLMSNDCIHNCAYCINRASNDQSRASFEPHELAKLVIEFYRRNYIEGLFLSSGVVANADETSMRMTQAIHLLRNNYGFNGYIHAKVIPATSSDILQQLGLLVDRLSINIELPSSNSLKQLAPSKSPDNIFAGMKQIRDSSNENWQNLLEWKGRRESRRSQELVANCSNCEVRGTCTGLDACYKAKTTLGRPARFAPAGQATQMIIGASPESDLEILRLTEALYAKYRLKRVFFSAYLPVGDIDIIKRASHDGSIPLLREHRLYQSDWLLRFYNFSVDELLTPEAPFLDPTLDPKCLWALRNLDRFPIEINRASFDDLIRVPGIGTTGARKIIRARKSAHLSFDSLAALRIVLKRAQWFITCKGKYRDGLRFDHDLIYHGLTSEEARKRSYRDIVSKEQASRQLSLFDESFHRNLRLAS
ncbi:MAG: putative DNA modification/repair radical SAM protein, partial [Coriobacteriia bacterium]|nr:putative DNA modification/repair radical SAM protein [Coriobacteriia bacterium]